MKDSSKGQKKKPGERKPGPGVETKTPCDCGCMPVKVEVKNTCGCGCMPVKTK